MTGEKLTESQVVSAIAPLLREISGALPKFVVMPIWGEPPRYELLTEWSVSAELATRADEALQHVNDEYTDKRRSGRLAQIGVQQVPTGTFTRFAEDRQSRPGASVEQYKHPFLLPTLEASEQFQQTYLKKRQP